MSVNGFRTFLLLLVLVLAAMKSILRVSCAVLSLMFCMSGTLAIAQWKLIQPHLVPPPNIGWHGGISFRDGVLWLARESLYRSTDSGEDICHLNTRIELRVGLQYIDKRDWLYSCPKLW